MPWSIKMRDGKHCVVKDETGETEACHDTHEEAVRHQRALYASEDASAQESTLTHVSVTSPVFLVNPISSGTSESGNATVTFEITTDGDAPESLGIETDSVYWEGVLGIEGKPTDDRRYLIPGEISEREMPLSLMIQTVTAEGHMGAELGGRIDEIWRKENGDGEIEIWGRGPFDSSDVGREGARLVEEGFLTGVSLDLAISEAVALHPETYEPLETDEMDFLEFLIGDFVTGLKGKIMGATLVPFPAFPDAKVSIVTASGSISAITASAGMRVIRPGTLVASASPLKPPRGWFDDPRLTELTPLTITKEGRVFGHLADWDGCHNGFQGVCVPPFRSSSNYSFFNTGEIETSDGDLVPCGKIMFCRDGNGHAPIELSLEEAAAYYDDATKVGAFVRAGSDRFGTWLAGALRSDLTDLEIQHLRTHPPSGDWRPTRGGRGPSELIAAFAVPIGGFTIPRKALVASADGVISAIITSPLMLDYEVGARRRKRKKAMLSLRLKNVLGMNEKTRAEMRHEAVKNSVDGED